MEKKYFVALVDGEEVETSIKSEYEQKAIDFLKDTDTTMKIERIDRRTDGINIGNGSNYDYKVTLKRNSKTWSFFFTDSINNYRKNLVPTAYDILACLQKYEVETDLIEFCYEFGYETDTREQIENAKRIHKACLKEYKNVMRLFEDVIDELSEIQ